MDDEVFSGVLGQGFSKKSGGRMPQVMKRRVNERHMGRLYKSVASICRKIWRCQGRSGQYIKLYQITPYVNEFQTLNNPGS